MKTLRARHSEVVRAIHAVLAQDAGGVTVEDPKAEAAEMARAQMVAVLVAATGCPPDLWERQVAIGYLREQFQAVTAQMAAENGGSLKDAQMVAGTRKMGLASEAIRKRHADQGAANG